MSTEGDDEAAPDAAAWRAAVARIEALETELRNLSTILGRSTLTAIAASVLSERLGNELLAVIAASGQDTANLDRMIQLVRITRERLMAVKEDPGRGG